MDASMWRHAAILREGLAAMGVRRPILLGHSAGGALALAYAQQYPEDTAGVVALAPICFPELRLEQVLFGPRAVPLWGDMLSRSMHASLDKILVPLLWRAMFLPQPSSPRFDAAFPDPGAEPAWQTTLDGEDSMMMGPDLAALALRYHLCRVPVHILGGDADLVLNNNLHGRQAAKIIPKARFDLLPGIGHMIHHVRIPEVVEACRALAGRAAPRPDLLASRPPEAIPQEVGQPA